VVDVLTMHREILNARLECNDIVIFIYGHYPLDPNAKSSDTICVNLSIKYFWIRIKRWITVYWNYNEVTFRYLQCGCFSWPINDLSSLPGRCSNNNSSWHHINWWYTGLWLKYMHYYQYQPYCFEVKHLGSL
jgi:hypothetical protein